MGRANLRASIGQANLGLPDDLCSPVRNLASEPVGLSRPARTGSSASAAHRSGPSRVRAGIRATDSRTIAAIGSADRAVSRIPSWRRSWPRPLFPSKSSKPTDSVQAHPDLKGDALAQAVDQQPWDPSVKALTAFPSVLGNMDKNLSWTSSLGDAYYNQQQDVMDAVQVMRQKAQEAGNLKSTPQQTVTKRMTRPSAIQPASPMLFMSPPTIRGWFTDIPLAPGRAGIRIPESGLAARTSRSESASESASSAVSDGAGVTGDSTGITTTPVYQPQQVLLPEHRFLQPEQFLPWRRRARRICRPARREGRPAAGGRDARASLQSSRRDAQTVRRKPAGCSRIRRTSRSERHTLGRLQWLSTRRADKELFLARKRQLGWRIPRRRWRRISRRWRPWSRWNRRLGNCVPGRSRNFEMERSHMRRMKLELQQISLGPIFLNLLR